MLPEFKSIFDLLKAFPTEQDCINHLETIRWNGVVVSPFDETSKVYKCANNKYKCKNTGKYFNVRTNTIFDNTKIELQKWFLALYVFSSHKKGISSHQLARDISVTQKSAWFLLHRLRYAFEHPNFQAVLGGNDAVEIDETFIGVHFDGCSACGRIVTSSPLRSTVCSLSRRRTRKKPNGERPSTRAS